MIDAAISRHAALTGDPLALAAALGGRELAAILGATLAARAHGIPVLLDGFVCTAAAAPLALLAPGGLDHAWVAHVSAEAFAEALALRGLAAERDRILAAAAQMPDWWCLRAEGPLSDAEVVLRQCLALQRKTSALHKELRSAEAALASDPTEQNFARLLDIKTGLADLANAEAAAEGFGELAGRRNPPT